MIPLPAPIKIKPPIKHVLLAGVIAVIMLAGGCSSEDIKRLAYTLGGSYSCMQSNNYRPNKGVKDLECTNPVSAKQMSYEDYKKQRKETLKQGE